MQQQKVAIEPCDQGVVHICISRKLCLKKPQPISNYGCFWHSFLLVITWIPSLFCYIYIWHGAYESSFEVVNILQLKEPSSKSWLAVCSLGDPTTTTNIMLGFAIFPSHLFLPIITRFHVAVCNLYFYFAFLIIQLAWLSGLRCMPNGLFPPDGGGGASSA